jgi:hypothetical protein
MQAGGPSYAVELGRLDGLRSTASSVNGRLPAPFFNLDQLNQMFAANGLSKVGMVALSGTFLIVSGRSCKLQATLELIACIARPQSSSGVSADKQVHAASTFLNLKS